MYNIKKLTVYAVDVPVFSTNFHKHVLHFDQQKEDIILYLGLNSDYEEKTTVKILLPQTLWNGVKQVGTDLWNDITNSGYTMGEKLLVGSTFILVNIF